MHSRRRCQFDDVDQQGLEQAYWHQHWQAYQSAKDIIMVHCSLFSQWQMPLRRRRWNVSDSLNVILTQMYMILMLIVNFKWNACKKGTSSQCRYSEIAQRIFKHNDIQYISLTLDKKLNSLIYRMLLHCVSKNRTPKTGRNNFLKIGPLWIIFSEDASAFNCELTAVEKLDMGWVLTARFPWQQQHHARALRQEANTRPKLKPLVVKVWGWLPTDHRWQGPHQWRKRLQAKGQHFEQLLYFVLGLIVYCLHWLKIFDDREIKT